ncbi:MAG: hypothetical protein WC781_03030 [Candidatus Pacearchaeota archaeon]|jgi:hypothetical protein
METLKKPQNGKFNMDKFVRTYIYEASDLARKNLPLEEFDEKLRTRLSNYLDIDKKVVIQLHHPCHWALFCDKGQESYMTIVSPSKHGDVVRVKVTRDYTSEDIDNLTKKVLNENATYYHSTLESLGLKV